MFFKLIICGERFYQELPLQDDTSELKIGTEKDCKIRINRALAQSDFEVSIYKNEGNWKIRCIKNSALAFLLLTSPSLFKLGTQKRQSLSESYWISGPKITPT